MVRVDGRNWSHHPNSTPRHRGKKENNGMSFRFSENMNMFHTNFVFFSKKKFFSKKNFFPKKTFFLQKKSFFSRKKCLKSANSVGLFGSSQCVMLSPNGAESFAFLREKRLEFQHFDLWLHFDLLDFVQCQTGEIQIGYEEMRETKSIKNFAPE